MTMEQFRNAYQAQPFHPFMLHLADGRKIPVRSREFISPAPSGRSVIIWQPDDSWNVIDLLLVTDMEFRPLKANGRKSKTH